jgi:SAM-dependent methyltransferase
MAFDYDKLYAEQPDALGPPTQVFVDFFDGFELKPARILDVGCGQGRDAVFLAEMGHRVVGVDISPNGIRDLTNAAEKRGLPIQGVVADIKTYKPDGLFDVILIDRTLHMLDEVQRNAVLGNLLGHVAPKGWVLIADEASNIPGFREVISADKREWRTHLAKRGTLFLQLV